VNLISRYLNLSCCSWGMLKWTCCRKWPFDLSRYSGYILQVKWVNLHLWLRGLNFSQDCAC